MWTCQYNYANIPFGLLRFPVFNTQISNCDIRFKQEEIN